MRKPKSRLARNLPFMYDCADIPAARISLGYERRILSGPVGTYLLRQADVGTITFLDKTPARTPGHLFVLGIPGGVLVVAHGADDGDAHAEIVRMCSRYRDKIVGGIGKLRWAKVKVAA